jgi:hypothetical protein
MVFFKNLLKQIARQPVGNPGKVDGISVDLIANSLNYSFIPT